MHHIYMGHMHHTYMVHMWPIGWIIFGSASSRRTSTDVLKLEECYRHLQRPNVVGIVIL